jgi:cytoskeletal protein CcmA (bactofilin family)
MTDANAETGSLIGKESEFTGKLTFLGTVRIEGRFEGEVLAEGTLVVAAGGCVRGRVEVGTLIVTGGLVEAQVVAHHAVELSPPGQLVGDVVTPAFHIERGAVFRGRSIMPEGAEPGPDAPKP